MVDSSVDFRGSAQGLNKLYETKFEEIVAEFVNEHKSIGELGSCMCCLHATQASREIGARIQSCLQAIVRVEAPETSLLSDFKYFIDNIRRSSPAWGEILDIQFQRMQAGKEIILEVSV